MKRNFLYTGISVGSRLLVGLFLFLLLARSWGPEHFGVFSFTFSAMMLTALLVDFGFGLYLMREVAARPEAAPELLRTAFQSKLLLTGAATVVAAVLIAVLGPSVLPATLAWPLFVAALAMSYADFFVAPLRALGRFDLEALAVAAGNALQFVLAGATAWMGGDAVQVACVMAVTRCVYLAIARIMLARALPGLRIATGGNWQSLRTLRRVLPYGMDGMLVMAWSQLDVVAVRALFGAQGVGLYSAGQKIVQGFAALAPVVGNVMIPRLSRLSATNELAFWGAGRKTCVLLIGLGVAFAVPLVVAPKHVSAALFGARYLDLAPLLPWFGSLLLVRFLAASAGVLITAVGLQAKRVSSQIFALGMVAIAVLIFGDELPGISEFVQIMASGQLIVGLCYMVWLWIYRRRD